MNYHCLHKNQRERVITPIIKHYRRIEIKIKKNLPIQQQKGL